MAKKVNPNVVGFFQKLARAFLIPVALIAVGSLMLGVASLFQQKEFITALPFLGAKGIQYFASVLGSMGMLILANLGLIYAVSLSFALVQKDKEYAAFSGFIGYYAMLRSMNLLLTNFPQFRDKFPGSGITTVLGVETVNVGIMGGILTGVLVALIHNRFRETKLPMAFAFFQGVRFVPIMSLVLLTVVGQIFPFLWIYIQLGIQALGYSLNGMGAFGPFVYGFVERALIPTGLHQIWNSVVRNTAVSGVYQFASGAVVDGCVEGYAHYLVEGVPLNATLPELVKFYFGPQIPMMLGGLPAIALAIYRCADPDKRKDIKPLVMAGALTAIFAGISEPIEFIFLFAAPLLFVAYAVLTGLSWLVCYLLGSCIGGANSSIIGYFVAGILRPDSKWYIVAIVTVVEFVSCYLLFRWWIIKFNVKTPGRGGDYDESLAFAAEIAGTSAPTEKATLDTANPEVLKAQLIIRGLGGGNNILELESCMSRLRVVINDPTIVDENILKKTGCNGIIKASDKDFQIVYGTTVGLIKKTIDKELAKTSQK
jgi:Phosphotransferase system IIC components, glucose/maltose/N-acetylglucosamine-specific